MKPARLSDLLRLAADQIDDGTYTAALQRTEDWLPNPDRGDNHNAPDPPRCDTCTDQHDPCTHCSTLATIVDDRTNLDRVQDAAAARLHQQLTATTRALEDDVSHWLRLTTIANPDRQTLKPATPADFALAGWCRSCARDDGHLTPVAVHPDGKRKYVDLCNGCGSWARDHDGAHPPLEILQLRHTGKRVTSADYTRIMGHPPK